MHLSLQPYVAQVRAKAEADRANAEAVQLAAVRARREAGEEVRRQAWRARKAAEVAAEGAAAAAAAAAAEAAEWAEAARRVAEAAVLRGAEEEERGRASHHLRSLT